jgi:hypothetical protein
MAAFQVFTEAEEQSGVRSPDGKKLFVARGHRESDVVLLRDTSK